MERYGNADLIRDILERQGLIWLLESLAQDENQEQRHQEAADMELMHTSRSNNIVDQESDDGQHVMTENDADHVYFINSGPGTTSGTFGCDNEVSYPLPFLQLRKLANRQHAAQQQVQEGPLIQIEHDLGESFFGNHRNETEAYQASSVYPSRTQKVNGWTCVTTRPTANLSPIPELMSKSYSAPAMRCKQVPNQTDGPRDDESEYQPASDGADLLKTELNETKAESGISRAVMRTIVEAAASKLLKGFDGKGRCENNNDCYHKSCGQIQHSSRLQSNNQQEIFLSSKATPKFPPFTPSISCTELSDTLSDDSSFISSYGSAIESILYKNAHKKSKLNKTIQQDWHETPLSFAQQTPESKAAPGSAAPERCIVEARLVVHLGARSKGKTGKISKVSKVSRARHDAKYTSKKRNEQGTNKLWKKSPKFKDGSITNDYAKIKYELVELPCYDDVDGTGTA